ncbi:MAG: GNAT family N-acetyltransferase, partial [Mycobacteriales bacterium]
WLRAFHRDRRSGLDGPASEATWAVLLDERVVGSVRLKRTDEQGVLEAGAWLVRGARGRGVGTAALAAVLRQASVVGATAVRADTTAYNTAALGALRRLGFHLIPGDDQGVRGLVNLTPHHSLTDWR